MYSLRPFLVFGICHDPSIKMLLSLLWAVIASCMDASPIFRLVVENDLRENEIVCLVKASAVRMRADVVV